MGPNFYQGASTSQTPNDLISEAANCDWDAGQAIFPNLLISQLSKEGSVLQCVSIEGSNLSIQALSDEHVSAMLVKEKALHKAVV